MYNADDPKAPVCRLQRVTKLCPAAGGPEVTGAIVVRIML